MVFMARPRLTIKKKHLNVYISDEMAEGFRDVAEGYGGKLGLCLCAAMLMFMEADDEKQSSHVNRVFEAELKNEISALISNTVESRKRRKLR